MADKGAPGIPFEGVTDYFSELNRMRHTGLHGRDQAVEDRQRTHASAWVPATDIFVQGDDLVITVELAGVSPDEVNISFAHGDLTISGNRQPSAGSDGENSFYVRERFYGEFRRAIRLPDGTQPSQIAAVFDNGLVEITVSGAAGHAETSRIELRRRSGQVTTRSLR
jgi:HSP20 family protein